MASGSSTPAAGVRSSWVPRSAWVPLGRLVLATVLVVLWIEAFLRVVTRVFVLNFSTAGPNATAVFVLLLVTGWTLPLVARAGQLGLTAAVLGGLGGLAVSTFADPVTAALGGVVAVAAFTQLLVGILQVLRERIAVAAALGVVVHVGLRSGLETAPTYATTTGLLVLTTLAGAVFVLWTLLASLDGLPPAGDYRVSAAPLAAFLFLEGTYLGAPHVLAAWTLRSSLALGLLSVAGALAGAWWIYREPRAALGRPGRWSALLVASLAGLLWLDAPGIWLSFSAQFSAVLLVASGTRSLPDDDPATGRVAFGLAMTQLVAVLVAFLVIGAVNWPFIPGIGPALRGKTAVSLLVLGVLLPGATFDARSRMDLAANEAATSAPDDGTKRRDVLAMGAAGALGVASVLKRAAPTAQASPAGDQVSPDEPVTVLSYNVHQYLAGDDDGEHNLVPLAETLEAAGAHLVGLQETEGSRVTSGNVNGVSWLANRLGYYSTYGAPTRRGGYGVALLSAWPISDERLVSLPVENSPPRWALVATVSAPWGDLPVVVTHFQTDTPGDKQLAEADVIAEWAADIDGDDSIPRAIAMGDFNVTPDTRSYDVLTESLTDAWTAAGNDPAGGATWRASDPSQRIDYVFTAGDWTVEAASTLGTPAVSDHLAVRADLQFE